MTENEKEKGQKKLSMQKSYHEQFRGKNQPVFNGNSKAKPNGKGPPVRPTAVKQSSPRSDTHASPIKRNEMSSRVPVDNSPQNSRRIPPRERNFKDSPPLPDNRRNKPMNRNDNARPMQQNRNSITDQPDYGRKPLRLNNRTNQPRRSLTPEYYQKPNPAPRDSIQKPRRMRVANDDYVIEHRRRTPEYDYDDYHSVSN